MTGGFGGASPGATGPVSASGAAAGGGLVAAVDRLAAEAGGALLGRGGSAADAAVGASAVLAVTTQHMCGMGGDLLAIVHPGESGGRGAPEALVAAGRAGSGASAAALVAEGHAGMPFRGDLRTVTVPGCVDGWLALHEKYGRLPLRDVLEPARLLAAEGFPVSPLLAAALPRVADVAGVEDYLADGFPEAGDLRRRPGVARALEAIGSHGRAGWYAGEFGSGFLRLADRMAPGWFAPDDLAVSAASWSAPLQVPVREGILWSTPPPSQGVLTLAALAVAERLGVPADPEDPAAVHLLVEANRVTAYDKGTWLGDGADASWLLDPTALDRRASLVGPRAARLRVTGAPGGTIYLLAIDATGAAVSLSQSNAGGFGAHLVVPEVGVWLQNRGVGFSLRPGAPNLLRAGTRPVHTLAPALVTGPGGDVRVVLGTMGGDAQPQVLTQLMHRLRAGDAPEAAVAAARWALAGVEGSGFDTWDTAPGSWSEQTVRVEDTAPPSWDSELPRRGHRVERVPAGSGFGHAQLAAAGPGGIRAAADPRCMIGAVVRAASPL